MATATSDVRQAIARVIAAGALALILGGLAVSPSAAQTRKQATHQANQESIECLNEGGNPDATTYPSGTVETTCSFDDGSVEICTWEPATGYRKDCHVDRGVTRPPSTHIPVGGGSADDGRADDGTNTSNTGGDSLDPGSIDQQAPMPLRHHHKHVQHRHHG